MHKFMCGSSAGLILEVVVEKRENAYTRAVVVAEKKQRGGVEKGCTVAA